MYYCFIKWSYEEKEMTRTRDRAIAYYRVSTEAQGLEGYGMEGRTLGNPNLQPGNARTAAIATEARTQKSKEFAQRLKPIYDQCISEGRTSLKDIAACLNEKNRTTARGKPWTTSTVSNLEKQLEVAKRS